MNLLHDWGVNSNLLEIKDGSALRSKTPTQTSKNNLQLTADMVFVSAGEFFMGCNEERDTECDKDEKPGRMVNVPAFFIDKTEVTVVDYRRCVKAGRCSDSGLSAYDSCNWGKENRDNHPINCTVWNQAKAFCQWKGKRLPTEAEWERAARGKDGRKYPWGNQWEAKTANTVGVEDGFVETAPVGSYLAGASPYGALDMAGNVWEWTADWYDEKKKGRSARGGSWFEEPHFARTSNRDWLDPNDSNDYLGFRCAK